MVVGAAVDAGALAGMGGGKFTGGIYWHERVSVSWVHEVRVHQFLLLLLLLQLLLLLLLLLLLILWGRREGQERGVRGRREGQE